MANPGQPTIQLGAQGTAVRRLQRALRRLPDLGVDVDGLFGAQTDTAVREFQQGTGLAVDGIVGPATWAALPDGAAMPTLQEGSAGPVVAALQTVLAHGAGQGWTGPGAADGVFGPDTKASVVSFQQFFHVGADGIVGDRTWSVSLGAASATLESAVGLQYVQG